MSDFVGSVRVQPPIDSVAIAEACRRSADKISEWSEESAIQTLTILDGGVWPMVDILNYLEGLDVYAYFCKITSYAGRTQGHLSLEYWNIRGSSRDIPWVIIDDICDSGDTIAKAKYYLTRQFPTTPVYTLALLMRYTCPGPPDFAPLVVESKEYLVGYGLDDYRGKRHLREIQEVERE